MYIRNLAISLALVAVAGWLSGCESASKESTTGAGIGAAAGALAGGIIGHQSGEKWAGAGIGAAIGGLAGWVVGKEVEARKGIDPDSVELTDRADRTPDPRQAISLYRQAVDEDPQNARAWNNMGLQYMKLGERESARQNFNRALEVDPDYQPAIDNLRSLEAGRDFPR